MSVLDWFANRFRHEASHFLYIPVQAAHVRYTDDHAPESTELIAGNHYFRLWLVEMFLKNDRDWFSSWHPAVHSAITFVFGTNTQVLTNLSSQTTLKDLNSDHLNKFLTLNVPLSSLLPFNGGIVTLDAGLVALKGGDDVKSLIKAMGAFGTLLAVPQLSAAVAIAGPMADAVGSLVGATDGELVIGLNQTFSEAGGGAEAVLRAGYYAIADATVEQFDREKFWVDKDQLQYGDSLEKSNPVEGLTYMLFRIEGRSSRTDWDELKSISDPYKNVLEALKAGQVDQAQVHLRTAILSALAAPELTKNVDRRLVVEQLKLKFEQDKKDLGAGAFTRAEVSLANLMKQAGPADEAASKPEMKAREALEGIR